MKLGCNMIYVVFMLTFLSAVTSMMSKSLWSYITYGICHTAELFVSEVVLEIFHTVLFFRFEGTVELE